MNSQQLRQHFIDFFKAKSHEVVPASSIVPQNDPTILFTNAGMNQFKDVFLGTGARPYSRAVDSQTCIRVSGKHNDLDDVGRDGTHLTSFEMLGNWSFGDYYKKEAILWAWEFLTETLNFPKHKLYATIYEEDEEAKDLWVNLTDINPEHIVKCGKKDNFWEMGESGPCGPCSEIHLDLAPDDAPKTIERDPESGGMSERYIELWNLVFIQYDRQKDGSLNSLPAKHVDTGAGLERLLSQIQGVSSVYETDLFTPIIDKITQLTGVAYDPGDAGMPHRVLADHVRTLSFTIADQVIPSNEGRGYVLRRLLRRAMRFAQQLGYKGVIVSELVDNVVDILGSHFTHLETQRGLIKTVIKAEEEAFLKTLESGVLIFEEMSKGLPAGGQLSGAEVFKLYDTYGFPADLTDMMAEERGLSVDMPGFDAALNEQKQRSQAARAKHAIVYDVTDKSPTQTKEEAPIHVGIFTEPKGGECKLVYSKDDQLNMARHHTATHLLHEALRGVLGTHVAQAGSLVDTGRLTFDFSHFQQVSKAELETVQAQLSELISQNLQVTIQEKTLDEAKAMGAQALFEDTYDAKKVRVVSIGDQSIELCGGNHVLETAMLERILITHESSVSTGIRRIEALVGEANISAYEQKKLQEKSLFLKGKYDKLKSTQDKLLALDKQAEPLLSWVAPQDLSAAKQQEDQYSDTLKKLEKAIHNAASQQASSLLPSLMASKATLTTDLSYITTVVDQQDLPALRTLSDTLANQDPNCIIALASAKDSAGALLVRLPKTLKAHKASDFFTTLTSIAGGKGGGPPHMAQGGGADPNKLQEAMNTLESTLKTTFQ